MKYRSRKSKRRRKRRAASHYVADSLPTGGKKIPEPENTDAGIVRRQAKIVIKQGVGKWKWLSVSISQNLRKWSVPSAMEEDPEEEQAEEEEREP